MLKYRIAFIVALWCLTPVAAQAEPSTEPVWSIVVVGLKGEPLGRLTLELTDQPAPTCMSGDWKRARILSSSFHEGTEFLAFEREGQVLTIQLNQPGLCDAYSLLSGKFSANEGKGNYTTLSIVAAKPLGTFTAKRR